MNLGNLEIKLHPVDVSRGIQYWPGYIEYNRREIKNDKIIQIYKVESESSYDFYEVKIFVKEGKIINGSCTCMRYEEAHSCKHLAAILLRKQEEILQKSLTNEQVTENILSLFYKPTEEKRTIKKELKLTIILTFHDTNRGPMIIPQIKIGLDKMYSLNNKLKKFYEVYDDESKELVFGKAFTYSKDTCYFSEEDEKLIDYLKSIKVVNENNYCYRSDPLAVFGSNISKFFQIIKNRPFGVESLGTFTEVKNENPYEVSLTKKGNKYHFILNKPGDMIELCSKFAVKDGEFYYIPDEIARLRKEMNNHGFEELVFEDKSLEKFSKGILKTVKDTIELDDTVKDKIVIVRKPEVKLYFDFEYDKIVCKINLTYGSRNLDYFDNDKVVLRDTDYENELIEVLTSYNFKIENKKIFIDDLDEIGEFLEEGLSKLTEKYDVFTSQKLKETKVKKDIQVRSSFGIGQDNIMSYKFN